MTYDIKELRLSQSISQKRLAHMAGIDVRTLRRMESGIAVSPESYRAACLALKVDPAGSFDERMCATSASSVLRLTSTLDTIKARSLAFGRTMRGRAIIAISSIAVAVCAGAAVHASWFRPNVSITIAFDRSCDELGIWSKTFSAMDREFPDGYSFKNRKDGTRDCSYTFEGYYEAAGPLDPRMAELVRNLEHAGTKTTVTYITEPQEITPRPREYWEQERRNDSKTVQGFSRRSYERVYRLDPDVSKRDTAYARRLFADQASFDSYLRSLKTSADPDGTADNGSAISVLTAAPSLSEQDPDGVWTVKFRSKISHSGKPPIDQCHDVTVRIRETDDELGILDIVSDPSTCRDRPRS